MKNMFGMNVYISEGRRAEVLKVLKEVVGIGVAASAASSTSHKHSHDRPSAVIDENNNKSDTNRMGNGVSSSENNGGGRVTLVSHFVDTYYNRSSFTLAACMNQQGIDALVEMAVRLAKQAIEEIDMEEHCARHPRLGVVDHISCHELRRRTITTAAETAEKAETILRRGRCSESDGSYDDDDYGVSSATLANAVGRALGEQLNIPVMMYGSATNKNINGSDKSVSLAEIRRSVGYFSRKQKPYNGNNSGSSNSETRQVMDDDEWTGLPTQLLQLQSSHSSSPSSQNTLNNTKVIHNQSTSPIEYIKYGPRTGFVDSSIGISCIGSVPWVTNFNVQLYTGDMILAKRIATQVSTRGGGYPFVETMALWYSNSGRESSVIEIACNLLNTEVTSPEIVERHVMNLAHAEGIEVKESYTINPPAQELAAKAEEQLLRMNQ